MAIKGLRETVKKALQKHNNDKSLIVDVLQDIQSEIGYLPKESLVETGKQLGVPVSRVYSVATFFKAFSLTKRGRHLISVCMGTACHVRGAVHVKEAIERELGIEKGGTTGDLAFSFETVRCLGCCGQAPVMLLDEDLLSKLKTTGIGKLLEKYR